MLNNHCNNTVWFSCSLRCMFSRLITWQAAWYTVSAASVRLSVCVYVWKSPLNLEVIQSRDPDPHQICVDGSLRSLTDLVLRLLVISSCQMRRDLSCKRQRLRGYSTKRRNEVKWLMSESTWRLPTLQSESSRVYFKARKKETKTRLVGITAMTAAVRCPGRQHLSGFRHALRPAVNRKRAPVQGRGAGARRRRRLVSDKIDIDSSRHRGGADDCRSYVSRRRRDTPRQLS